MLNQDVIIQRLSHIKQLYQIGCEQSKQFESIAVFSILSFHDSIEMFLKLLAEHKDINSRQFNFLDYWDKIPDLTLKESMRNLNARRVNLKHKGLLPAKSEIDISRVNAIDFYEQNTFNQFGINFSEISLINLVAYSEVRKFLKLSEDFLAKNEIEDCLANVAIAFDELLSTYEKSKSQYFGRSPFFFGQDLTFNDSYSMNLSDRQLSEFVDKVKESIESIQKAVKITSFGIDYKKYVKFKMLTPSVQRAINGAVHLNFWRSKKTNKENCQFCIDFVIYSALTLQEFDFDFESLGFTE